MRVAGRCCLANRKLISSSYFFFSSRRRHTRCSRDWSSDVCSSDLIAHIGKQSSYGQSQHSPGSNHTPPQRAQRSTKKKSSFVTRRSEERRVGKEGRSRRAP